MSLNNPPATIFAREVFSLPKKRLLGPGTGLPAFWSWCPDMLSGGGLLGLERLMCSIMYVYMCGHKGPAQWMPPPQQSKNTQPRVKISRTKVKTKVKYRPKDKSFG